MYRSARTLLVVACAAAASPAAAQGGGTVREMTFRSEALAGNRLGDPVEQRFAVYLPPSYEGGTRRYPVLFLLHGIADSYEVWTRTWQIPALLDRLVAERRIEEMIVVFPNAGNRLLGSYYANSPVTGRWEDVIAVELVGLVDRTFRTLPSAASRGVAGHSMGGFGAIRLGMRRPDVFGAVYAISPCCLDAVEDIGYGNQDAWRGVREIDAYDDVGPLLQQGRFYPVAALGLLSALFPDSTAPLNVRIPFRVEGNELLPDEPAYTAFRDSFPIRQVARYRDNLRRLRALRMDYGFRDQFAHIPPATAAFSRALAEHHVPHVVDAYAADHRQQVVERLGTIIFPFFSATLAREATTQ